MFLLSNLKIMIMFVRRILSLPGYTLSAIVFFIILYLTLFPDPLPDVGPELFEGADKVVHALMFLGMAGILGLDYLRSPSGAKKQMPPKLVIACAVTVSVVIGGLIEVVQDLSGTSRSGDFFDFIADAAGAAIAGIVMVVAWKQVYCWWWNR